MQKKCSCCIQPLKDDYKGKTCEHCRERAVKNRKKKKLNTHICKAIKKDGSQCNYKVSPKCENIYCAKHSKLWKESLNTNNKNIKKCSSKYQCDPNKPGIKAILPTNYKFNHCENCRQKRRSQEKKLNNSKLQNTTTKYYKCIKCPKDAKLYTIDEMEKTLKGITSKYCIEHFRKRQEMERNRPKRNRTEYYRKYAKKQKSK